MSDTNRRSHGDQNQVGNHGSGQTIISTAVCVNQTHKGPNYGKNIDRISEDPRWMNDSPLGRRNESGCCWLVEDRMRFLIAFMGLIGLIVSQMSRMIINVTVTYMARTLNSTSSDGGDSCPWVEDTTSDLERGSSSIENDKLDWDADERDLVLSSFFMTYCIFMIPGKLTLINDIRIISF